MREREYIVPVFHIERADKAQRKILQTVLDILEQSGIAYCIVDNGPMKKQLQLFPKGVIDTKEILQICGEVQEMYADGKLYCSLMVQGKKQ